LASVREQLNKHRLGFGTDLVLKSNLKPYINAEIFHDDIKTTLLANLVELRGLAEFAEEMTVLLMDDWSGRITSDMFRLLIDG
jgi:hypothetical protein